MDALVGIFRLCSWASCSAVRAASWRRYARRRGGDPSGSGGIHQQRLTANIAEFSRKCAALSPPGPEMVSTPWALAAGVARVEEATIATSTAETVSIALSRWACELLDPLVKAAWLSWPPPPPVRFVVPEPLDPGRTCSHRLPRAATGGSHPARPSLSGAKAAVAPPLWPG